MQLEPTSLFDLPALGLDLAPGTWCDVIERANNNMSALLRPDTDDPFSCTNPFAVPVMWDEDEDEDEDDDDDLFGDEDDDLEFEEDEEGVDDEDEAEDDEEEFDFDEEDEDEDEDDEP